MSNLSLVHEEPTNMGDMLTLFQSEDVATGSSAANAMLLAAITRRMDISKYLKFTT